MQYVGTLITVKDMAKAIKFYTEVMGLEVVVDFGENVTLSGGLVLQTVESWKKIISRKTVTSGCDNELYFEETDIEGFLKKLKALKIARKVKTETWGQRSIRFCDYDKHRIEVGENMVCVVKRFSSSGMSKEQIALRMDVPISYVEKCLKV